MYRLGQNDKILLEAEKQTDVGGLYESFRQYFPDGATKRNAYEPIKILDLAVITGWRQQLMIIIIDYWCWIEFSDYQHSTFEHYALLAGLIFFLITNDVDISVSLYTEPRYKRSCDLCRLSKSLIRLYNHFP